MKYKVTTVEEIEVDIQYPSYKKDEFNVYKFIDDNTTIQVNNYMFNYAIITIGTQWILANKTLIDATETEFLSVYATNITNLNKLISNE